MQYHHSPLLSSQCSEDEYTFCNQESGYVQELNHTIQRLHLENTLKQQAIETASRLILELKDENLKIRESSEQIIAKQQQQIALLRNMLRSAANNSEQQQKRQAEKVKLRARFKNLLNVSTSSTNNSHTISQSSQYADENDPQIRGCSVRQKKYVKEVDELKKQLDLKDRKVNQLMKVHEMKEGKYMKLMEIMRTGSNAQFHSRR